MRPIQMCSWSLSYFRPIVRYCIFRDRSNTSPIRPCPSNISYFRRIIWYCMMKDRSNMRPMQMCSRLSYFRPIV